MTPKLLKRGAKIAVAVTSIIFNNNYYYTPAVSSRTVIPKLWMITQNQGINISITLFYQYSKGNKVDDYFDILLRF